MRGLADLVQHQPAPDPDVAMDQIETRLAKMASADLPLKHYFTPGLYVREILIPRGVLLTTKVHRFEHPFVVSQGVAAVRNVLDERAVVVRAPHTGITRPGTRRLVYALEDVIWLTFHANPPPGLTDPDALEDWLSIPRENPLLPEGYPPMLHTHTVLIGSGDRQ